MTKEYLDNNTPTIGISRVIRYYDSDSHIELDFGGGVENRWEYGRIYYNQLVGKPELVQRKNGNNWVAIKTINYDIIGRVLSETDGEGHTTSYEYDALNREIKTVQSDTTYTTFAWDDCKVTVTDAKGNIKTQYYDLLDRLIQVDEYPQAGATYSTKYLYDTYFDQEKKASHLVRVTNAQNANTNYTYDHLGRLLQVDYPQDGPNPMKPEVYSYDPVGNLISKTVNGKTKSLEYEFYAGYRVTKVTEPDNRTVTYQYDNNDNITDQIVSNGVNYHFDYDARNRVTSSTAKIDGRNFVFGYGYDLFGRVVSINYPNRTNPVTYQYDDLDRLQSIGDFVNSCSYDLDNKLIQMVYSNGVTNNYTYDVNDRPTNINAGGGSLLNLNYTYDSVGNIKQINSDYYDYDGMNRLTWYGNKPFSQLATANGTRWSYDDVGNMTGKEKFLNGGSQGVTSFSYDLANRLWSMGSITYDNDALGARIGKYNGATWQYIYDGESRLTQVNKNGVAQVSNIYDGNGMRVKKDESGKTTYYLYSGSNPLLEYSPNDGSYLYRIYAGNKAIAEEKNGVVKFYHKDHLGSTRVVTNAVGAKIAEYKFAPYGEKEISSGDGTDYGFTDKTEDASTGLKYFGARFYDAEVGRFINLDPKKDGLNWFEFCRNNPVLYVDPNGLEVYVGRTKIPYSGPLIGGFGIVKTAYHTFVLVTNKPITEEGVTGLVFEAGPSKPNADTPFGTLEVARYTSPEQAIADPKKYGLQEIPTPEMYNSWVEFKDQIVETYLSYFDMEHPNYDPIPTTEFRNSNSFTGSILRSNGSGWHPDYWVPGFDNQIEFSEGLDYCGWGNY